MRRSSLAPIPEDFVPTETKIITKKYPFETITPMFGGDSQSWQLNLDYPLRSQAIKGQLRFWWRTMQHETDIKTLLYQENRIWGGKFSDRTDQANRKKSPVAISLLDQHYEDKDCVLATMKDNHSVKDDVIPGYVLFPITSTVKDGGMVHFIKKLTFTLQVIMPADLETEVENTLLMWTLFGGVGARTRRGTGSLFCQPLLTGIKDGQALRDRINQIGGATSQALAYPRLAGCQLAARQITGAANTAGSWHAMLGQYGAFRQDRKPGNPRPGRSHWPEPDAIRLIANKYKDHKPDHQDRIWFPRAAFGLPILTRFNNRDGQGDPTGDFHLEPDIESGERWPSPLILKVVRLDDSAWQIALALQQSFPQRLRLKGTGVNKSLTPDQFPANEDYRQSKIMKTNQPLAGRSIYQALFDYLKLQEIR